MNIQNRDAKTISTQVSKIGTIDFTESEEFKSDDHFLIKNVSLDSDSIPTPIMAFIKPAGQTSYIETILFPGWNPELCQAVKLSETPIGCCPNESTTIKLQYGW